MSAKTTEAKTMIDTPQYKPLSRVKWAGLALAFFGLLVSSMVVFNSKALAAACTAPSTDYGTVTQTVAIPADGTYRVWSRIMAPDTTNNSYLLEVDGSSCFTVGDSAITANTWTWVNYQNGNTGSFIDSTLTQGNHTIKMIGREPNVKLDRVIFTADTSCTPNNTRNTTSNPPVEPGDNCANPPDTTVPTVSISSPANNATVPAATTITAVATDNVAIKRVEFYVDNTLVGSDTTAANVNQYSFAATLSVGSHSLVAKAFDTSDNTASSSTVTVTVADTTAPTISAVASSSITQTSATVTWTTNEASDSQVEYGTTTSYGSSTTLNTTDVTSHSVGLTGLTASTTYHYRVKSRDAANNLATGTDNTFTTQAPAGDTTKPTVSMTAPSNNASVNGASTTVSATATDNVGVVGVQFKLDGANVGAEDMTPSGSTYSITWDTTAVSNGTHTLTAVARDAAGNTQTSTGVTVTVNNVTIRNEDVNQDGQVNIQDISLVISKYGQTGTTLGRPDVNHDNTVNIQDISLVIAQYGK